ncbi:hypothetical protein ACFQ1I_41485 [Kitasatospora arboriphila]
MGGAEPRAPERGRAPWPPIDLLGRIRHDPTHMAERAALFGVERLGRESVERLAKMRRSVPPEQLKHTVIERGVHTAIAEGAFVGGPFMGLIPVMFCAALLAQGRMVLELAELSGRSATDPERAVDMLVLQGAYPTREEARRAIAELPEPERRRACPKARRRAREKARRKARRRASRRPGCRCASGCAWSSGWRTCSG